MRPDAAPRPDPNAVAPANRGGGVAAELATLLPRWELIGLYRMRVLAERHCLSLNEYAVLTELLLRPRGISGTEVAETVGLATGGTTRLLARLEERDLVVRDPDPADARRLLVRATPEARALLWDDVTDVDTTRLLSGIPTERLGWATAFAGRVTDLGVRRVQALRDRRFPRRRRPAPRD